MSQQNSVLHYKLKIFLKNLIINHLISLYLKLFKITIFSDINIYELKKKECLSFSNSSYRWGLVNNNKVVFIGIDDPKPEIKTIQLLSVLLFARNEEMELKRSLSILKTN